MRLLSRRFLYRVIAPEGKILSFAQPKESIKRKDGSIAAVPALLARLGIIAAPLWANPNKTCHAQRGK
jgi:hypothetical protein